MRYSAFVFALSITALAQGPALVTVYTPGGYFKGAGRNALTLATGRNTAAPSAGAFIDGEQKLTMIFPHQFATFELPAGAHRFKASDKDEGTEVTLAAGKQYFFELTATKTGAYIVQVYHPHLAQVDCKTARAAADTNTPVKISRVDKAARNTLANGAYFPRCAEEPTPSTAVAPSPHPQD